MGETGLQFLFLLCACVSICEGNLEKDWFVVCYDLLWMKCMCKWWLRIRVKEEVIKKTKRVKGGGWEGRGRTGQDEV